MLLVPLSGHFFLIHRIIKSSWQRGGIAGAVVSSLATLGYAFMQDLSLSGSFSNFDTDLVEESLLALSFIVSLAAILGGLLGSISGHIGKKLSSRILGLESLLLEKLSVE